MNEQIEMELAKQRRAALDLIAARCAEALRVVERQAGKSRTATTNLQVHESPARRRDCNPT